MGNRKKSTSGMTLVEVLIASVIALMIGGVVVAAFLSGQRSFVSGTTLMEVHGDARVAMDWLSRDIKWAHQVVMGSVTIGADTYTTGASELVLSIPSVDASGDIIDGLFDTVVYTLNATDLMRIVAPDPGSSRTQLSDTIANNVTNLRFTTAADNIAVSLTAQKTVLGGRTLSETLSTSVALRNF